MQSLAGFGCRRAAALALVITAAGLSFVGAPSPAFAGQCSNFLGCGAPGTPTSVTARAVGAYSILLGWSAEEDDLTGETVDIYASVTRNGQPITLPDNPVGKWWKHLNRFEEPQTHLYDNNLDADTTYCFAVEAVTDSDNTPSEQWSGQACAITLKEPAQISGVTATNSSSGSALQTNVTWTASGGSSGGTDYFHVGRGVSSTFFDFVANVGADVSSYQDGISLAGRTQYFYQVCAVNNLTALSYCSSSDSYQTPSPLPQAPSNVTLTAASDGVHIAWSSDDPFTTTFAVDLIDQTTGVHHTRSGILANTARSFVDQPPSPTKFYTYEVCAVNGAADSVDRSRAVCSAPVTVNPFIAAVPAALQLGKPNPPQLSLTAQRGVDVHWGSATANAISYEVELQDARLVFVWNVVSPTLDSQFDAQGRGSMDFFDPLTRGIGARYTYRLCALSVADRKCSDPASIDNSRAAAVPVGLGPPDNSSAAILPVGLGPPAPLNVTALGIGGNLVFVRWSTNDLANWYEVERQSPGQSWKVVSSQLDAGPFQAAGFGVYTEVASSGAYLYRVCAGNVQGRTCSSPVSVTVRL